MTAYCCPTCRVSLTFRPADQRARNFIIPHSDDFAGCDVCGVRYCATCSRESAATCRRCGGALHEGRSFQPTGVYRLPMGLEELPTKAARLARAREVYEQGLYGRLEYQAMLDLIEELGDAQLVLEIDQIEVSRQAHELELRHGQNACAYAARQAEAAQRKGELAAAAFWRTVSGTLAPRGGSAGA